MNKSLFLFLFSFSLVVLLSPFISLFAQQTPQSFLSKFPALPQQHVCDAKDETIIKWNDKLLALKNEMTALQMNERKLMEQAISDAQPRTDMFEPANVERTQKLGKETEAIENEITTIIEGISTPFIEKKFGIELKYLGLLEQVEQRKNRCKEISAARLNYLADYQNKLDRLIELGVAGNKLSDEMIRTAYTGYSFRTQYGLWLEFLIGYANELSYVYDDIPLLNTEPVGK